MADTKDEEFGYGKAPKSGKFKPGQSGNPKGRPKAAPKFEQLLAKEGNKLITVTVDGKKKRLTQAQVVAKAIMQKAMKGDLGCAKLVILGWQAGQDGTEGEALISPHELALLQEVLDAEKAKSAGGTDDKS